MSVRRCLIHFVCPDAASGFQGGRREGDYAVRIAGFRPDARQADDSCCIRTIVRYILLRCQPDAGLTNGETLVFESRRRLDRCRRYGEHLRTEDEFRTNVVCAPRLHCKEDIFLRNDHNKISDRRLTCRLASFKTCVGAMRA